MDSDCMSQYIRQAVQAKLREDGRALGEAEPVKKKAGIS